MSEDRLHVDLDLPCAVERHSAHGLDALWQEGLLSLRVMNLMEGHVGHEGEAEHGLGRLEAKLDLVLYLLARNLHHQRPPPPPMSVTLWAGGFALQNTEVWRPGDEVLLTLYPSAALPLPLVLPATVVGAGADGLRAEWPDMPKPLLEAWEQWLFRQHRRTVHDLRKGQVERP